MPPYSKEPPPPPSQIKDLTSLLADASISCATGDLTLQKLVDINNEGRPAMLNALKAAGLSLGDRQKLCGAVAKAARENRFNDIGKEEPKAVDISDYAVTAAPGAKLWEGTPAAEREVAILFPGQGTQKVGMAAKYVDDPLAKALFDEASKVFGYSMQDLCQQGPQEKLDKTLYSQPAIFVCSLAAMETAKSDSAGILKKVKTASGFSLGEYSALVFGGALSFADGLKVVKVRAEAMNDAAQAASSGMASIGPLDDDKLQKVLDDAATAVGSGAKAYIANYMFPGGRTCSGDVKVLEKACELAKAAGAANAKLLPVSGAFHTPYMASAAKRLSEALDAAEIKMPSIHVYSNVTGKPYTSVEEIKTLLKRQLLEPVLWEQGTKDLIALGHKSYVEAGPGKQLKAMMRRIDQEAWKIMTTRDP